MRQDIKIILKGLTDKDPSDSIAEEKTIKLVDGLENSYTLIDDLRVEIHRIKDFRGDRKLFYNLYLSVAYLIQKDFKSAKEVLENAIQGFQIQGLSINEALGEWLFGIIHFENGNNERAQRACKKAIAIMKELIMQCERESKYEKAKVYKKHLKQMERFHKELSRPTRKLYSLLRDKFGNSGEIHSSKTEMESQVSRALPESSSERVSPDPTPFRNSQQGHLPQQDHGEKPPYKDEPPKDRARSLLEDNNEPLVEHIIIPVDMRALRDKNPKLNPLKPDLFNKLQSYEEKIVHNNDEQTGTQSTQKETKKHPKQIIIPSFPIYGQIAAGTKGEPNLDSEELVKAKEVYDNLRINFDRQEHEVKFVNNEQINFLNGKRYGWLKVVGDSMNRSAPIAINNGDYVLFSENHDAKSCILKIIVASLPEVDTQPPQLVVKRLLKLSTQSSLGTDGFESEYSKFMLHSESSLDEDPQTGMSYKKDMEIIKNYQIVGEVVAIAKPL